MAKKILIFSDGTGQIGGQKPDQRWSNIYKMYRAMRPGPDSPISYGDQIAYYDPGLGAGETDGAFSSLKRVRNAIEAAVGQGIDENVIDCYIQILSHYQPGDRIFLFGFSRGAYTVRALANVMNLCGVPTKLPNGEDVPKDGPWLRKIAREAVKTIYGHGAGKKRTHEQFHPEREEKGRRFRAKYSSAPPPGEPDVQGNVQPDFIGVFDTVAALGNRKVSTLVSIFLLSAMLLWLVSISLGWPSGVANGAAFFLGLGLFSFINVVRKQVRYYDPDPDHPLRLYNPFDWLKILKHTHYAVWNTQHYDRWLDSDVGYARHAMAIDENRRDFPRVKWASTSEVLKNAHKTNPRWLDQKWFAGCHSDIGGSYPETESRLSDIAMDWMVAELKACFPTVQVRSDQLQTHGDALGLQHEEDVFIDLKLFKIRWARKPRVVENLFSLHPTVIDRLNANSVPHPGSIKPYRPEQLRNHPSASKYYS